MRSTQCADRRLGRLLDELFRELARRAIAERRLRMDPIVMLEQAVGLA
jgi:hypothetical protein